MSTNLGTEENPIIVFVSATGNVVDATVRAPDRATFEAAAQAAELMVQDETGAWHLSKGVHMDHIGPVEIAPAVIDDDGHVVTPPVLDDRHHVNIRMVPPSTLQVDDAGTLKWHKWALAWTMHGSPDTAQNASEEARVLMGVSLIDPDTISSPSRVWL